MSPKPCKTCEVQISWSTAEGGFVEADGNPHSPRCPKPCRDCSAPTLWDEVARKRLDPATRAEHLCPRVPAKLTYPVGHHTSPSRIARHDECPAAYVQELDGEGKQTSRHMDSGSLCHAAIEVVAVERLRAGRLAETVTAAELLAALEVVTPKESWSSSTLAQARGVLQRAGDLGRVDLSCAASDDKGPLVERAAVLPCGEGVLAGLVLDLVELVGEDLCVVTDWKGGLRWVPPRENPAIGLYAAWGRLLYPERRTIVAIHWLALSRKDGSAWVDEIPWSQSLEDDAKAAARALVLKTRRLRKDREAWEERYDPEHCGRCAFKATCKTYQAALSDPLPPGEGDTLEEILPRLAALRARKNQAESAAKILDEKAKRLASHVVDADGRAVVAGFEVKLGRPVEVEAAVRDGYSFQRLDVKKAKEDARCLTETSGALAAAIPRTATEPPPLTLEASPSGPTTSGSPSTGATSEPASGDTPKDAAEPSPKRRKPRAKPAASDGAAPTTGGMAW